MTDGIEKSLNLKPLKDVIKEENPQLAEEIAEQSHMPEAQSEAFEDFYLPAMAEKTEDPSISVNEMGHDDEMNNVAKEAMATYRHIFQVAQNVNPERSARLFEVAGQYLKLAVDTSNSKVDRQVQVSKLKLLARKLDVQDELSGRIREGKEIIADRNQILKQLLKENQTTEVIDAEASTSNGDDTD